MYLTGDQASYILRTQNSRLTCKPYCYLVLSTGCKWTDKDFCM